LVKRKCQTNITRNSPATITTRVIVQDPIAGSDKNKDIIIPPNAQGRTSQLTIPKPTNVKQ
jgi:hypothetical protein